MTDETERYAPESPRSSSVTLPIAAAPPQVLEQSGDDSVSVTTLIDNEPSSKRNTEITSISSSESRMRRSSSASILHAIVSTNLLSTSDARRRSTKFS